MTTAALSQSHFRGRADADLIDATPTWIANEDTNWSFGRGKRFRVRFTIQETAGGNPVAHTVKLQYSKNGGAFADVTGSSANVRATDASASADEAAIATKRLGGTGTFVNGRYDETGATSTSVDLAANNNTEYEFGLVIVSADVAEGDTLDLKVVALSGTSITPTVVPRVTVSSIAVATRFFEPSEFALRWYKPVVDREPISALAPPAAEPAPKFFIPSEFGVTARTLTAAVLSNLLIPTVILPQLPSFVPAPQELAPSGSPISKVVLLDAADAIFVPPVAAPPVNTFGQSEVIARPRQIVIDGVEIRAPFVSPAPAATPVVLSQQLDARPRPRLVAADEAMLVSPPASPAIQPTVVFSAPDVAAWRAGRAFDTAESRPPFVAPQPSVVFSSDCDVLPWRQKVLGSDAAAPVAPSEPPAAPASFVAWQVEAQFVFRPRPVASDGAVGWAPFVPALVPPPSRVGASAASVQAKATPTATAQAKPTPVATAEATALPAATARKAT